MQQIDTMGARTARTRLTERSMRRIVAWMAVVLLVGIPLIGIVYFLDQAHPTTPSLVERTIATAEAAVRENPNALGVRVTLAEAYAAAGRQEDALRQYDEVLKAAPENSTAVLGRAVVLLALDRLDDAKAGFRQVVETGSLGEMANVDPQVEEALYHLGQIALRQDDVASAVTYLSDALRIDRTDADALDLLGTALVRAGDPANAIVAFGRAVALVPTGWCEPYSGLASAYAATGDTAGAGYAGGMVAFCEGRIDEARTTLEAQVSGTHAVEALVGLGLIAEQAGDAAAAAAAYARVIRLDPQDFAAISGLNRLGADANGTLRSPAPAGTGSN
jgi:tetratricopeptide (TPR) repeat protein